jgi:hypothetical protein
MEFSKKTRNLSIYDLFEALQKEHIIASLRCKIYPQQHKQYWQEICDKKKIKILDISKRNRNLPNIFDDKKIKDVFESQIFPEFGKPNFIYRDDIQKSKLEHWDIKNYFSTDSDFKAIRNSVLLIGKLKNVDLQSNLATLDFSGEKQVVLSVDCIARIL